MVENHKQYEIVKKKNMRTCKQNVRSSMFYGLNIPVNDIDCAEMPQAF